MLSHENLAWTAKCAVGMIDTNSDDCVVSYLPLSHIAEQMFTLHVPATTGAQVYFAESIEKVADNFKEVQPTVLFAVPRIWEKFYAGVSGKLALATGPQGQAGRLGARHRRRRHRSAQQGPRAERPVGDEVQLLQRQGVLEAQGGLGPQPRARVRQRRRAHQRRHHPLLRRLDIVIREVYGQSEDTGPTTFNLPGQTKFGSVGRPIPGMEVKIAEDGEIVAKGPNVFMGYYKTRTPPTRR